MYVNNIYSGEPLNEWTAVQAMYEERLDVVRDLLRYTLDPAGISDESIRNIF